MNKYTLSFFVAVGLGAGMMISSCKPANTAETKMPSAPPGVLPAEWRIPVQYQGEWHSKLENCAKADDRERLLITPDHVTLGDLSGPVQASSTNEKAITIVANLTGEGTTVQRALGLLLLTPDKLTTDVVDEEPITFLRCPAAGKA